MASLCKQCHERPAVLCAVCSLADTDSETVILQEKLTAMRKRVENAEADLERRERECATLRGKVEAAEAVKET